MVSIRRLDDLQEAVETLHRQGYFDEEFYQERLADFTFTPPVDIPGARSLIIIAFKDPQVRFSFRWNGEYIPAIVPPTYLHWREKDREAERALAGLLEPEGYRVAPAVVPKKMLAVSSGLATYGKNNITYVEGVGGFHRLAAFCSDLPCDEDEWVGAKMMRRCEQCQICLRSCPTGAIGSKRLLLRAERCLVFWNEKPGEVAFPVWMDASWHHCLVGCMNCQRACPENRRVLDWCEEVANFSEEETRLLLERVPQVELPGPLMKKLERSDLLELLDILPRNLKALLDKGDTQPAG